MADGSVLQKQIAKMTTDLKGRFLRGHNEALRQLQIETGKLHRNILSKYFRGRNGTEGLNRRTGITAKSWHTKIIKNGKQAVGRVYNTASVGGNKSLPAVFVNGATIVPKNAKWLTIPVNGALTRKDGPARFKNVKDAESNYSMPSGSSSNKPFWFYQKDSDTAFLIAKDGVSGPGIKSGRTRKKGKNAKRQESNDNRILFVLKKKVEIPAYLKSLPGFYSQTCAEAGIRITMAFGRAFNK